MVDFLEMMNSIPCKKCILLAMCINNYKCECKIVDDYIKDTVLDPLWPFHPRSVESYELLSTEVRRILRKDIVIRNGRDFSFFKSTVREVSKITDL